MARIVGGGVLVIQERFREVATERVAPRVARQLVRLLDKIGRRVEDGVEISLSREELAQMTGTTLFTVSRLLSAWEERGIVKPRREGVTICDVPALNAISEDDRPPGLSIRAQLGLLWWGMLQLAIRAQLGQFSLRPTNRLTPSDTDRFLPPPSAPRRWPTPPATGRGACRRRQTHRERST